MHVESPIVALSWLLDGRCISVGSDTHGEGAAKPDISWPGFAEVRDGNEGHIEGPLLHSGRDYLPQIFLY